MKYKIYDYEKNDFKESVDENRKATYYIKVNSNYIKVSKEVYLVCKRSYQKMKYDLKRDVARSLQYFEDIDQATSFIFLSKNSHINTQIYLKDLANLAVNEIHKLSDKYKDIAICIFLKEMNIYETSQYLNIPKSTIYDRKIKIQKILQEILKKSG